MRAGASRMNNVLLSYWFHQLDLSLGGAKQGLEGEATPLGRDGGRGGKPVE